MAYVQRYDNGPVYLEPIEHVYIKKSTNEKYTSVTKILHSFVEPFEEDAIAERISKQSDDNPKKNQKYIGLSKEEILDLWKEMNDTANEYGTALHEGLEKYLLSQFQYKGDTDLEISAIKAYEALNIDHGRITWPERIMFSEEHKLAGTSDIIIDIDDVYFDVLDFKGLPLDTPIFTSNGWKTMGTLTYEDLVYDKDGNLCRIKVISDIKNKKCYEMELDNGELITSDFEHRWLISFQKGKNKFEEKILTTEELFFINNELKNKGRKNTKKLPKIMNCKPLNNKSIDLPIDPYLLGVWLGDGHSADTKITQMNENVWDELTRRGFKIGEDVSQGSSGKAQTKTVFGLLKTFNEMNLIKNKHIPDIYFLGSFEQRLDLLRGFMDADGHFNKTRNRFVMSTTKDWQVKSMVRLLGSLGVNATVIKAKRSSVKGGVKYDCYDICFSTTDFNPFLSRNENIGVRIKTNKRFFRNIKNVREVESTPTICIEVDSPSHTFLYGDYFTVTHNTNKEFNYYNKFKKQLKKPLDHLQDCQFHIYSLQLSVYAYMYQLEFPHKKCRNMSLLYWNREDETFSKIPVIYLKNEAKKILDTHKHTMLFS